MTRQSKSSLHSDAYILSLFCVLALVPRGPGAKASEQVFPLEAISVFDPPRGTGQEFLLGQRTGCGDKPDPNVAKYPRFASGQPLYGKVSFAEPWDKKKAGPIYFFAFDESGGTGQGYDRLYFDLNHDRDLTNDKALTVQKNPPPGAVLNSRELKQQVCFENLALPFPCGPEAERPLEMTPRLWIAADGNKVLSLLPTRAFRGRIELGGQTCDVLLGHCYYVTGWFDRPWTALQLIPLGGQLHWRWPGGDRLSAMHKIAGAFYTFSAAPTGEKLMVHPYEGPLGVLEVGPGGRNLDRVEISGSLRSAQATVALGEVIGDKPPQYTRSYRLPVGDYRFEEATVHYGELTVAICNNDYAAGERPDSASPPAYPIAIRADEPFVFDFSNHPAVLFVHPAPNQRFKPGEELGVKAVFIDPGRSIMLRGLIDQRQRREAVITDPSGKPYRSVEFLALDPKVTITRANGEIVAEGTMPFG
jgi:hypothetical protein